MAEIKSRINEDVKAAMRSKDKERLGALRLIQAAFKQKEVDVIKEKFQQDVSHFVVALDALAVYVHPENPLTEISLADLKQIYGEGGTTGAWEKVSNWPAVSVAH